MKRKNESEQLLKRYSAETKRHFNVVMEDLQHEMKTVAEQVTGNSVKLAEHDQRFDTIDEVLALIKIDVNFIKHELKQKVSRDEFAVLEKRVGRLETKLSRAR